MEGIKIFDKSKTLKSVTFRIDGESAGISKGKALQRLSGSVKVPGFRKGRVPAALIEKEYAENLKSEREKIIIAEKLNKFADEKLVKAAAPARLVEFKWNGDEPESFSVEIEVIPEFDVTGYKKIAVKAGKKEITAEDEKKALENLRENASSLEDTGKDTPEENLFIKYDLDILRDGDLLEKYRKKNLTAEVNKDKLFPGMWPDILKLKKGTPGDIALTAPDDFQIPELAGRKITFRLKITAVLKKKLPEADDAFAKLFGAADMNQLRDSLKKRLMAELEYENKQNIRRQITDRLLKKNPVEIPRGMLDEEKEAIKRSLANQYPGEKLDKHETEIEERAKKNISLSLVLGKIAQKENISLTEEDYKKRFGEKYSKKQAGRAADAMLTDKIFDFIISEGKIK